MDGITPQRLLKVVAPPAATRLKTEPVNRVEPLQPEAEGSQEEESHHSQHEYHRHHHEHLHLPENADTVSHVNRLLRQKGMPSSSSIDALKRYRFKRNRLTGSVDLFDETLQDAVLSLSMEEMAIIARFLDESSGVMSDCAG
ncbi:MAG: hypothetical protein VKK59_05170 [Vampirovibrionales bacterium]|nr:hypothetical protein [Vampirovibrionales bacterium]